MLVQTELRQLAMQAAALAVLAPSTLGFDMSNPEVQANVHSAAGLHSLPRTDGTHPWAPVSMTRCHRQLAPLTQDLLRALCKKGEPPLRRELETALVEVARPRLSTLHNLQLGSAGTTSSWRRKGY